MSGPDSGSSAMFAQMAAERLRARCRWGGLLLLAAILVPFELVGGRAVFVWSVLPELEPAARLAALAPPIAGLVLILLGLRPARPLRPTSRAIAVLATFVAFLAVFALTAAGAALRFHPRARRAGSALLMASLGAALTFYLWPSRGEVPAETITRAVLLVATLPDPRFQIGYGMVLLLVLAPLVVALVGLFHLRHLPARDQPGISILAVWGMPGLVLLFVYRAFLAGGLGVQTLATAFSALVLAAVIAPLAAALEVLVLGVTAEASKLQPGMRPAVAGALAAVMVASLVAVSFLLGRPAPKGVDWKLTAPSPAWDEALGTLLPSWQEARLARDSHARAERGTGAEAQVATKARARALIAAAKAQPAGRDLAAALEVLAREVDDLELSGRAFGRLVAEANDAARRADLPYYLDPSIRIGATDQGMTRRFHLTAFRVEEVHGWMVGKDRYATLIVAPLTPETRPHLGFSRDQDPFALVVRSSIGRYVARFDKGGEEICGASTGCKAALAQVRGRLGAELEKAIQAGTERHELQHQIDGPHLPLSGAVSELLAGFADEAQDRANRELSAYIAEMTTRDAPPQLTLLHLHPFGMTARGGAEHRVAVILLETLSGKRLRLGAREVDPATWSAAFEAQVARGDDELREAARRAYRRCFGVEMVEPVAR